MSEKENGGQAFPSVEHGHAGEFYSDHEGMTLRDWFAGQALASMNYVAATDDAARYKAKSAYMLADAMIEARKK